MSTVQSSTAAGLPGTAAPAAAAPGTDIQDRFLKLLVTQMKNQDPLNPMDNAQVTSQLAQISTVNGIQQLNTTMQSLSSSFLSSQSMQSTSLIGHTVLTDGNSLNIADGVPAYAAIELAQAADSVKVNIVSPAGNIVRQLDLGPQPAGLVAIALCAATIASRLAERCERGEHRIQEETEPRALAMAGFAE